MASIVMADDGIEFDGLSLETGPLGGAETAFVSLAEALAARGHTVTVVNRCAAPMNHRGVEWRRLDQRWPENCDLYIANRGDKLLPRMPAARRRVFWIHNPASYLLKWRYLSKLWRLRPAIVFSGAYHAATYPRWAPAGQRVIIPYGIADVFRNVASRDHVPERRAIFTSSPLRSLDWLLELWAASISPEVRDASLQVFSGAATYGSHGAARGGAMNRVLERATALRDRGVVLRAPVSKSALADELRRSRVLLYRGDVGETFCLAVGEAQAAGVPCVVQDVGCVAERVIDGETGIVARDDKEFVRAALDILTDDDRWRDMSAAAIAKQRRWGWPDAAAAFEALIP